MLRHPVLRRILPGIAISFVGDGMALVAVALLARDLEPSAQWVGFAVAAYTLPGAISALVLGRFFGARSGAQLAGWDAALRAGALAAISAAYLFGVLGIGLYVALLAVSSVLHSWGSAGRYTLLAEVLPQRHHLAGNAVITTFNELGTIAGPPLAGLLIVWKGAVAVIAVDALTFALLAATYRRAVPAAIGAAGGPAGGPAGPAKPHASRAAGLRLIWHDRKLAGLLALTFGFFFLFGPTYVALPLAVAGPEGSGALLAAYYTAFGIGAVFGGLVTAYLRSWSLWPTTIGIVTGFGAAMVPLGLPVPTVVAVASFAACGLVWAPYVSTSMALFQRTVGMAQLPQVLAVQGAVTVLSVPLGTAAGGFLVSAVGARQTLLLSAISLLVLGLVAASMVLLRMALVRRRLAGAAAS